MVNPEIRLIIFFAAKYGEALYSQQKQDQELTVPEIMEEISMWIDWVKKITFIQAGGPHATHLGHDRTKMQSEGWFAHLLLPSHIRAHGSWAFQLYSPGGHWHHWPLDLDWVTPPTLLVFQMVGYRTVLPVLCEPSLTKMSEPILIKIFFEIPLWSSG